MDPHMEGEAVEGAHKHRATRPTPIPHKRIVKDEILNPPEVTTAWRNHTAGHSAAS
ncbi:hypothetical protein JCM16814_32460 [Desulfobaculum senezii]